LGHNLVLVVKAKTVRLQIIVQQVAVEVELKLQVLQRVVLAVLQLVMVKA